MEYLEGTTAPQLSRLKMVVVKTVRMVRQDFDHSALRDASSSALGDHPLELRFQRRKSHHSEVNLAKLSTGDPVGRLAGLFGAIDQTEEFPDRQQGKAEFAAVPDEGKPVNMPAFIKPLVAG